MLERIRPYLDYVFPNSNVCINDEWTLEGQSSFDALAPERSYQLHTPGAVLSLGHAPMPSLATMRG